ncbi:MAG TPA: hypothetical protein VKR06_05505 [Ktedonosporobacter sp.]|nr:hypothetical protein [Ktedonosporobacter sp.]
MPHWSFSKEANTLTRGKLDDSYQVITTVTTPVPTSSVVSLKPTATVRASVIYFCARRYPGITKRVIPKASHPGAPPRKQAAVGEHKPPVTATQTLTMTPVASPTIDALPSRTATVSVSPTLLTNTPTVVATTSGAVSGVTPGIATATVIATGTIAPTATIAVTPGAATGGSSTDVGSVGADPAIDIADDGWDLFNSPPPPPTPDGYHASPKPGPSTNTHYRQVRGKWLTNCLRNSIADAGEVDLAGTLTNNASTIVGGATAGTMLFYGVAYLVKRRKRA